MANAHVLKSIAFPSLSTGIYKYPKDLAGRVAVETVRDSLAAGSSVEDVTFMCFSDKDLAVYLEFLE